MGESLEDAKKAIDRFLAKHEAKYLKACDLISPIYPNPS
jgi:hypothetical protein